MTPGLLDLDYSELLNRNRELGDALAGAEAVSAAVLANTTVDPLKEILEYALRRARVPATVRIGGFDSIVQDSERCSDCRIVAVFFDAGVALPDALAGLLKGGEAAEREFVAEMARRTRTVLENLKTIPLVLFNLFCPLPWTCCAPEQRRLDRICAQLEQALDFSQWPNVAPVDLAKIFARIGVAESVDWRLYYRARALYSLRFLTCWVDQVEPILTSLAGTARKALIFDCDNTLWQGILGEDGFDGIEMGMDTPRGRVFREVQQDILELAHGGVILGLCSRNNPDEVDEVLARHPDMLVREPLLSVRRVNWEDKVSSLAAIAKELNIGLDAIAFVDDSPQELLAVEQQLPEVAVFQVPVRLSEYPSSFRRFARQFALNHATGEDARRTAMYRSEALRRDAAGHFATREDYLRSLQLRIRVHRDNPEHARRVAQLTQKTNQFNLTTIRYTEAEVLRMVSSESQRVLSLEVSDRFGEYGITGVAIYDLRAGGRESHIDTLLLSCRVLGREVELALMDALIDQLRADGVATVHARYVLTRKNTQAEWYFERCGFSLVGQAGEVTTYALSLPDYKPFECDYIARSYA